jgi:biotin carboxyl carrier protein
VLTVRRHDGRLDIGVDGQVVPFQEVTLSAQVAGQLVYKAEAARAGRFAEAQTVLFRIDDRDYSLEVRRLQNQLEQAGVSVQELDEEIAGQQRLFDLTKDQLALSQKGCDREADLHRRAVASEADLERAQRDVINTENALTTIRNQLGVMKTRRSRIVQAQELAAVLKEKAELDLARTTIAAPLDGVIVKDLVEKGDHVHAGAPLVTIEDTSAVEVKCNLRMDEFYWVWDQKASRTADQETHEVNRDYHIPSTPATVVYHLRGRDYIWDGQLWRIDGVGVDERTRTAPCRVIVRKPQEVWVVEGGERRPASGGPPALARGMYVDVVVHVTPTAPLFRVPERAVRPGERIWAARPVAAGELSGAAEGAGSGTHSVEVVNVDVVEIVGGDAVVSVSPDKLAEHDLVVVSPLGVSATASSQDGEAALENTLVVVKHERGESGDLAKK